jgi:hypothetical protein
VRLFRRCGSFRLGCWWPFRDPLGFRFTTAGFSEKIRATLPEVAGIHIILAQYVKLSCVPRPQFDPMPLAVLAVPFRSS